MDSVTVSRTVYHGGTTITESATAHLPDDLPMDDLTECQRRALLAEVLFQSLPSLHPKPCPPPTLNSLN